MPRNDPEYMKEYMRQYRAQRKARTEAALAANKDLDAAIVDDGMAALVAENARLVEEVKHLKQQLAARKPQVVPHMPVIVDVGQFDDGQTKTDVERISRARPAYAIENADQGTVDWLEKKQREAYASYRPVPKPGKKR